MFRKAHAALLALCVALTFCGVDSLRAQDSGAEGYDSARAVADWLGFVLVRKFDYKFDAGPAKELAAATLATGQGTFVFNNFGYTKENGEPTFDNRMTKTGWGGLRLDHKARVVVHTFGSGFNTVLAAYRGTTFANMVRVAGNDDRAVPGFSTNESLIRFDASANTDYRIQLGGRNNAEGLFAANVFVLPPTGGLSAYLLRQGSSGSARGADYDCSTNSNFNCPDATYIVYNSTAKTLVVTASHNLGAGITPPPQFTLPPGALRAVTFTFTAGFNHANPRTVSGRFTFIGREGATVISQTFRPATIGVKPLGTLPNALSATLRPQLRAGLLNQPLAFELTLRNGAAVPLHGCYIHPYDTYLNAVWQRITPADATPIGAFNAPATIPAGQSQTFVVYLSKRASVFSYLPPAALWKIECADSAPLDQNLQSSFDAYARVHAAPPDVVANVLAPAADTLLVPAAGGVMRVAARNNGVAGEIEVTPKYEYPVEDASNKRFTVTVCQLASANGACLSSPTASVTYTAAANAIRYFKVFVKRPAGDPGFAPTKRRVFINFRGGTPLKLLSFGTESVAVRWQ